MHPDMQAIRCSIVRGGTSKAVFFLDGDLPREQKLRDKVIQSAFGGVDVRQIDGLAARTLSPVRWPLSAPLPVRTAMSTTPLGR